MTLQQLKYVIAVAETKNISKASEKVFISQPSLTAAVHQLEEEMGVQIFSRTNKGVQVSKEGEEFLAYARQVVEQANLLEERFAGKSHESCAFSVSCQHYSFAVNAFVDVIKLEDLQTYPYLIYEQGEHNSFYFAEEPFPAEEIKKTILVRDRATLFNLLIGLNGFTVCSGVISRELNGKNIIAKPLDIDLEMDIGIITKKNCVLSRYGKSYVEAIKKYVEI